jgi:hypothetical protein
MPRQFRCGDVVELNYDLSITVTLPVNHPVATYHSRSLELSLPTGAQATIEKVKNGEAYLCFPASDDVEVRRWVAQKYLKRVQ